MRRILRFVSSLPGVLDRLAQRLIQSPRLPDIAELTTKAARCFGPARSSSFALMATMTVLAAMDYCPSLSGQAVESANQSVVSRVFRTF